MSPDDFDEFDDYDEFDDDMRALDGHESAMVRQDLRDLERFEETFGAEGYRGVSVYCHDCQEEHYYPWDMLRENLTVLLETGDTPVHEPAFAPDPDQYIPWEYARGYVDALTDAGVGDRAVVDECPRCRWKIPVDLEHGNFCPRCGSPLMHQRLRVALEAAGLDEDRIATILRETGLLT